MLWLQSSTQCRSAFNGFFCNCPVFMQRYFFLFFLAQGIVLLHLMYRLIYCCFVAWFRRLSQGGPGIIFFPGPPGCLYSKAKTYTCTQSCSITKCTQSMHMHKHRQIRTNAWGIYELFFTLRILSFCLICINLIVCLAHVHASIYVYI